MNGYIGGVHAIAMSCVARTIGRRACRDDRRVRAGRGDISPRNRTGTGRADTGRTMKDRRATRRAVLLGGAAFGLGTAARRAAPPRRIEQRLSSGRFMIGIDRGAITSLRCRGDRFATDYVRAGAALGVVGARVRGPGLAWRDLTTAAGSATDRAGAVGSVVRDGGIELASRLMPVGDALHWTITVSNHGTQPVEIGDLLLPLPMPDRFGADQAVGEAVLKHSFVSGHGSHVFWMRSNSVGPYLLLLPEADTHLEYWERRKLSGDATDSWCVFVHAGATLADRVRDGGHWRLPVSNPILAPGARRTCGFRFLWVADYAAARAAIAAAGLIDVEVVPGMTVPSDLHADIALASHSPVDRIDAEFPGDTHIERRPDRAGRQIWRVRFGRPGENRLTLRQPDGRTTWLEFFATEPVETMIAKRAAFIVRRQHRDPATWYDGLFGEWNMESQTLLGPDNYDRIRGWRVYAVTCDDPGLSKPAYLAIKNAEHPVADEVAALDRYIDRFVWGGLQMTTGERHPYAIYGIIDWKRNRESVDPGPKGRDHVWRPYDYPHIFAMYHAMHRVARDHPAIPTRHAARDYLTRAWGTAMAMFTVPMAVTGWSAHETGFYNECMIPDLIADLRVAKMAAEADALAVHWARKVRRFVGDAVDLFGSEYPFDSTGFESTQALARCAIDDPVAMGVTPAAAQAFAARQIAANLFCRGWLEPAYYYLGSDYRGPAGDSYTLTYMAQMGGWAIIDHALNDATDPFPLLRLGYASQLSAWALLNAGPADAGHGYWYPGEANDGAAGGGFEPAASGMTWLDQPHGRGSWYYSCEIDLGYCGAVRAATTIMADDPVFGRICYGGRWEPRGTGIAVTPADGVRRRLHLRLDDVTLDLRLIDARFATGRAIMVEGGVLRFAVEPFVASTADVRVALRTGKRAWVERTARISNGVVSIAPQGFDPTV